MLQKIIDYKNHLEHYNKAINLYSRNMSQHELRVHLLDSIHGSKVIFEAIEDIAPSYNHSVVDLGSGNGLPGIVFSILYPHLRVVLFDTDERKCTFLKSMVHKLNLNSTVVNKNYLLIEEPNIFISKAFMKSKDLFTSLPKGSHAFNYVSDYDFSNSSSSSNRFYDYRVLHSTRYIEHGML